jgi:hypothetical protein
MDGAYEQKGTHGRILSIEFSQVPANGWTTTLHRIIEVQSGPNPRAARSGGGPDNDPDQIDRKYFSWIKMRGEA